MKKLALLTTITAALTMVACNKTSKDAEALSKFGDLQGTHTADATVAAKGEGLAGAYVPVQSIKVTGATFKMITTYYKNSDLKDKVYSLVETGDLSEATIGGATQQKEDPKGKYIKIEYKSLVVIPESDEGLKYVNSKQTCGVKNIKKVGDQPDVAKDQQESCIGDTVGTRFNAYSTEKSSDGKKSMLVLASAKGWVKDTEVPISGNGMDKLTLSK